MSLWNNKSDHWAHPISQLKTVVYSTSVVIYCLKQESGEIWQGGVTKLKTHPIYGPVKPEAVGRRVKTMHRRGTIK